MIDKELDTAIFLLFGGELLGDGEEEFHASAFDLVILVVEQLEDLIANGGRVPFRACKFR